MQWAATPWQARPGARHGSARCGCTSTPRSAACIMPAGCVRDSPVCTGKPMALQQMNMCWANRPSQTAQQAAAAAGLTRLAVHLAHVGLGVAAEYAHGRRAARHGTRHRGVKLRGGGGAATAGGGRVRRCFGRPASRGGAPAHTAHGACRRQQTTDIEFMRGQCPPARCAWGPPPRWRSAGSAAARPAGCRRGTGCGGARAKAV